MVINKTNLNSVSKKHILTIQIQVETKTLNTNIKKADIVMLILGNVDLKAKKKKEDYKMINRSVHKECSVFVCNNISIIH